MGGLGVQGVLAAFASINPDVCNAWLLLWALAFSIPRWYERFMWFYSGLSTVGTCSRAVEKDEVSLGYGRWVQRLGFRMWSLQDAGLRFRAR